MKAIGTLKQCSKCKCILQITEFYKSKSESDTLQHECKACDKQRKKSYSETRKEQKRFHDRQYALAHKKQKQQYDKHYRQLNLKRIQQYRESHKEQSRQYREAHKEQRSDYGKHYYHTPKGKENRKKQDAKRRRNLGWIPLCNNPFDESELVDWHHIDNEHVIALPRDLHQLYKDKNHKENLKPIIKQIYKEIEKCQMKKVK
jgi:hypothetical protein